MEEEKKSLVETVSDLNKKIDELSGKKESKKKLNIPLVGWVYGFVLGGLWVIPKFFGDGLKPILLGVWGVISLIVLLLLYFRSRLP